MYASEEYVHLPKGHCVTGGELTLHLDFFFLSSEWRSVDFGKAPQS